MRLDDPRLDGYFHNKHASGFCKVYPGLDRAAWTGAAGGLTALYITCMLRAPSFLATDRKAKCQLVESTWILIQLSVLSPDRGSKFDETAR